MKTANPANFLISDWEVKERYYQVTKIRSILENNGRIEMTKEEKKNYMSSFYVSCGAVKPHST